MRSLVGRSMVGSACCHLVDVLVPAGERQEAGHQRQDPDPAHHHLDHADIAPDGHTEEYYQ